MVDYVKYEVAYGNELYTSLGGHTSAKETNPQKWFILTLRNRSYLNEKALNQEREVLHNQQLIILIIQRFFKVMRVNVYQ